jgi:hypothetical protein
LGEYSSINLTQVTKRIDYDPNHGVEGQEVISFLELVKTDGAYNAKESK